MSYTATQWSTAADKTKFAKQFKAFVAGGFAYATFTQDFYKRLSMTFGFIAHYDRDGFYGTYFVTTRDRAEFVHQCVTWPCPGDPAWTYSDVERDLKAWLLKERVFEKLAKQRVAEDEQAERAELTRLKAKYEGKGA